MKLKELIQSDLARFEQTFRLRGKPYSKTKIFWESFLFKAGFQAVFLYRLSYWCYQKKWIYPAWFLCRLNLFLTGAEIEFNARIGPGMFIAHPVGIMIGRGTVIGSDVSLFQAVSFGVKSWRREQITKFPKVGDRCFFFANAVVLGDISIGDDCVIGAHALVNKDMPDGSLARGVPAQIIPHRGKEAILSWKNSPQEALT